MNPGAAMRNTADRYGTVARALHWSMGVLLVAQVARRRARRRSAS